MEDFVPYELAVKLKEKGYPQHITDEAYIVDNYGEDYCDIGDRLPIILIPDYMDDVAAPTISQTLNWLMYEKGIYIRFTVFQEGWYYEVELYEYCEEEKEYDCKLIHISDTYNTYKEAALAAVQWVIDDDLLII